jgi:hypothetical protein
MSWDGRGLGVRLSVGPGGHDLADTLKVEESMSKGSPCKSVLDDMEDEEPAMAELFEGKTSELVDVIGREEDTVDGAGGGGDGD